MSDIKTLISKALKLSRNEFRRRRLEAGEAGWGQPVPLPPQPPGIGSDKTYRVCVIGAGAQGRAQCQGLQAVKGIEIAGLADINPEVLRQAGEALKLPAERRYSDAAAMLAQVGEYDLVSVATTAPSHIALGRIALAAGAKRIILEKPIANALPAARDFVAACAAAEARLAVNHSRRWTLDYRAIKRCVEANQIGAPRHLSIAIGKAEVAMLGTHYFDLCRFLLDSEPAWVIGSLEPVVEVNTRGNVYRDPSGFCLFGFQNGARAFIDFSSDLLSKDPLVTLKGTLGRITVDEKRASWSLQSQSQRVWHFPFAEPFKASSLFARVATETLTAAPIACDGRDGLAALAMTIGVHLSHQRWQQPVAFPLPDEADTLQLECA